MTKYAMEIITEGLVEQGSGPDPSSLVAQHQEESES